MLQFWEETRTHTKIGPVMVTLQGTVKGEIGDKWHMLPLIDNNWSGLEVRKWVGIWLNVLV